MRLLLFFIFIVFFFKFNAQNSGFEFEKCPLTFQESKTELSLASKQEIDSVWDKLKNENKVEFSCLSSNETSKFSEKVKYKLSLERAQSIEQYFYEKEVSPRYINFNINYFDHYSNGNCGTKENIKSFKNTKGVISPLIEKGTYYRRKYNASESNLISKTCQSFNIDAFNENIIEGEQGTTIKFPYECFDMDYTKENRIISVLLCEYYSVKDMILSGLTTECNGAVIETGGMIYLDISVNGKKLKLKKGVDIQVLFPYKNKFRKDDMLSFIGQKKDGLINWNLDVSGKVVRSDKMSFPNSNNEFLDYEGEEEAWNESEEEASQFWKVDGYLMNTNNIGWINCDRFIEDYEPTEIIVKIQSENKNLGTRILFTDLKSILSMYEYSPRNEVKHSNLPFGKEVYIISYTILKDNENALLAYKKVITGEEKRIKLTPVQMTVKELIAKLDLLSRG